MSKYRFLRAFFSPFKRPKLKFYIGKVAIGTPYFLPRKWVHDKEKKGYRIAVRKKIGFDFVSLGWKTKFGDFRFEWAPLWSFVFFKWQIAVIVKAPHEMHYWESWLDYEFRTDQSKTKRERIKQCRLEYPNTWSHYEGDVKVFTDYYTKILKQKYLRDD